MHRIRVLFLCTGNSARSQMAQAFLQKYGADRFEAFSAGLEPSVIHPLTVQVMEEIGVDMSGHYAKGLNEYLGKLHFSYLVTVCSRAEERCPIFPGRVERHHWPFDDPSSMKGTEEEIMAGVRRVRDEIEAAVRDFAAGR